MFLLDYFFSGISGDLYISNLEVEVDEHNKRMAILASRSDNCWMSISFLDLLLLDLY
jgi:hypothetical protein